jgi:hypothetical protein
MGIDALLTASPQVESMKVEPYSVDEIDQLLNGPRVWATVIALRNHMTGEQDEATDDEKNGFRKVKTRLVAVREKWEALTRELTKANGEAVEDAMVELENEIEDWMEARGCS